MINSLDPNALTMNTKRIRKTRCFPIELSCSDMPINTQYDVYMDGVKINAFCKPYGKNLGGDIISDANGKIMVLLLLDIPYDANYLTTQNTTEGYYTQAKIIEFRDPSGKSSKLQLPINLKVTK
jgi:hypothetical protein